MKPLRYLILPVLFFFTREMHASISEIGKQGLKISFLLSEDNHPIENYTLVIYRDGEIDRTMEISKSTPVYALLDLNSSYTLRFTKPGFKARMVLIDTHVPKGSESEIFHFDFEIEMLEKNEPSNTLDDLPVALLKFNTDKNKFSYSSEYAASIFHQPGVSNSER